MKKQSPTIVSLTIAILMIQEIMTLLPFRLAFTHWLHSPPVDPLFYMVIGDSGISPAQM